MKCNFLLEIAQSHFNFEKMIGHYFVWYNDTIIVASLAKQW